MRMRISTAIGAEHRCVFEQGCDPGCSESAHRHKIKEGLTILAGRAQISLVRNALPRVRRSLIPLCRIATATIIVPGIADDPP